MSERLRVLELSGPDADAALDWLYVHAEVRAVVEQAAAVVVCLVEPVPELPDSLAAVGVREVPVDFAAPPVTGLERDAAIVVADDLLVRPPWVERPAGFAGVELVVPRGAAFGSGEHDSTKAALSALHALWNAPQSCADVGTGSGILLLYASVRGCEALQACDIEAAAVQAAAELLPMAEVRLGGPASLGPADCVIANMTGTELQLALAAILELWNGRGPLVLSGMRASEVDGIRSRLPRVPDYIGERGAFTALGLAGSGVR